MSDELLERIRKESTSWLREQVAVSTRLIHESGQLLRGAGSSVPSGTSASTGSSVGTATRSCFSKN